MIKEYLPLVLIVIGLVNITIIFYFRYFVNKVMKSLSQVILLNKELFYNIEDFLRKVAPILYDMDIKDYGYYIYFQDKVIASKIQIDCKNTISETISVNDNKVILTLCPNRYIGENKDKFNIILKTLALVVQEDLLIKSESTTKSFLNISKFHTFILHDIKNISQFFNTLQYNIDKCKTQDDKNRLFDYLKSSNKLLNNKSSKIVKLLEQNSVELDYDEKNDIGLKVLIQKIVFMYNLSIYIKGDAIIKENEILLQMVFENIIKNIVDKKKKEKDIKVSINIFKKEDNIIVSIIDDGSPIDNLNKIFTPFYTTKKSGLGIGLYKVQTLLKQIDANLEVSNLENGVEFKIKFIKYKEI